MQELVSVADPWRLFNRQYGILASSFELQLSNVLWCCVELCGRSPELACWKEACRKI